jgi:hypothetical protein
MLTLNGSESWKIVNGTNSYFALTVGETDLVEDQEIICSRFETTESPIALANNLVGISIINSKTNSDSRILLRLSNASIHNVELLQNYLANNPLTVAYKLARPTYEPISFDNEYLVWDKGEEQVLTPEDENGLTCFDYGANTTEENEYIVLYGSTQ